MNTDFPPHEDAAHTFPNQKHTASERLAMLLIKHKLSAREFQNLVNVALEAEREQRIASEQKEYSDPEYKPQHHVVSAKRHELAKGLRGHGKANKNRN